jgi:mono/diheme cytochrome c family protein
LKRLLFTCISLGVVATAMSLSAYSKTFAEKYDVKKGSKLAGAACAVCHVKASGGKLNPYGKDIAAAMKADGSKKMTAANLAKVEGLDSDKDGKKNGEEIKSDSNPGAE